MQPQTAKMIFPNEGIANQVCEKLKGKGDYTIVKLPQGWQVVTVTKLPAFMPPAKPLPVQKPAPLILGMDLASGPDSSAAVVLEFKFKNESPNYLTVIHEAKEMHFGKGTLIAFEKSADGMVKIKMPTKVAQKRGLI